MQAPQLVESVSRLTQTPLHWLSPAAHLSAQLPPTHTSSGPQTRSHAPQWRASLARRAQEPSQSTSAPTQPASPTTQRFATHEYPSGHGASWVVPQKYGVVREHPTEPSSRASVQGNALAGARWQWVMIGPE